MSTFPSPLSSPALLHSSLTVSSFALTIAGLLQSSSYNCKFICSHHRRPLTVARSPTAILQTLRAGRPVLCSNERESMSKRSPITSISGAMGAIPPTRVASRHQDSNRRHPRVKGLSLHENDTRFVKLSDDCVKLCWCYYCLQFECYRLVCNGSYS